MAKKKSKQQHQQKQSSQTNQDELSRTPVDFTSTDNWDAFYRFKDTADESYEWYAHWPEFHSLLVENLLCELSELEKPLIERMCGKSSEDMKILVPGCGNSKLSEHLYDLGFRDITNVDFSKVVILDMLRKNMRERPHMKWRVMDMTDLKFPNESFDAVVDKGGLDVLMSSKIRPRLGYLYLSEVKRVLTAGGRFICLTLAESHVLDLLFHKFRFGWKMSLHMLDREPYNINPELQIFVVVVEKDCPNSVFDISSFLDGYSVESHGDQARDFHEVLEKERKIRAEIFNNNDFLYSLEDLRQGAQGDISVTVPGRRIKLILGEPGVSRFSYNGILLDAKSVSEDFLSPYAVFLVPREKATIPFYASEEGQWNVSEKSNFPRLLLVILDTCNSILSAEVIQADVFPLAMELTPANYDCSGETPFLIVGNGVEQREVVHQDISDLTGSIMVADVMYKGQEDVKYRRLIFQRAESLVQSEALMPAKRSFRRRRKTKQNASPYREVETDYDLLSSLYHLGVVAAILLLSSHFSETIPEGSATKALVIGLGGGILPMFFRKQLSNFKIEVVELDPMIVDIAREYFGFKEDEQLEVHIGDGIQFVKDIAEFEPEAKSCKKFDVIIVDVDSTDSSGGMSYPDARFVEESFIMAARESHPEQGLFIMNLGSRSSCLKQGVYSMLKKVFTNVFRLKVDGDANELLLGVKTEWPVLKEEFSDTREALLFDSPWDQDVIDYIRGIEQLR